MNRSSSFDESHQPVMWWRGHGIYAAHFVVLVFVVSMLATSLLLLLNVGVFEEWLPFVSPLVLQGEVWRIVTYGLWNPPSIEFVIDMAMLAWFGREVEKFFGRQKFLQLFAGLYLVSPVLFTLFGRWLPTALAGETGALAVFVAFATLYPGAVMMFDVLAMWAAIILVGIFSLIPLASRNLVGLVSLWSTVGYAFGFVRYQQGRFTLPRLPSWRRRRVQGERAATPAKSSRTAPVARDGPMAEIDVLLDKIAHSGISSLTAGERAKLESARAELKWRQGPR